MAAPNEPAGLLLTSLSQQLGGTIKSWGHDPRQRGSGGWWRVRGGRGHVTLQLVTGGGGIRLTGKQVFMCQGRVCQRPSDIL